MRILRPIYEYNQIVSYAAAQSRAFLELLRQRLVLLDGAMGTMLERQGLSEEQCRGSRFADWPRELRGNHDLLSITQPQRVADIHRQYLQAGADVISTNTFNATALAQEGFGMGPLAAELNETAARLARSVADEVAAATGQVCFVAGVLGPTGFSVSRPHGLGSSFRPVSFQELAGAYAQATRALIRGGVDILLIETVFDARNAQAALSVLPGVMDDCRVDLPVIVSATLSEAGRLLSGHRVEAFWDCVRDARPAVVGINCVSPDQRLQPHLEQLAHAADCAVCLYPSAGLPAAPGDYPLTPELFADLLRGLAGNGLLNLLGGCCGTTPEHIRAAARAVAGLAPRPYQGAGL